MYNPDSEEFIIRHDGHDLPERPTLSKKKFREWIKILLCNPEYFERLEDLTELFKSMQERVQQEEQEKIQDLEKELE